MSRYRIEQAVVTVLGFSIGAALAMCIAPGDMLLWVAAGVTLTLFAHAFFIRDLGGELLWPLTGSHHLPRKKPHPHKPRPSS